MAVARLSSPGLRPFLASQESPSAAILRCAPASRVRRRDAAPVACRPLLTQQRRHRLTLALRALDGCLAGEFYRVIAAGLFGDARIPAGAGWKTHDLRDRTIRLVRGGLELTQGGYLDLLRQLGPPAGVAKTRPLSSLSPSRRCSAILAFDLPPLSGGWLQDHGVR
jgi:hypothetical protein